jgi:hypothetical protein
MASTNQIIVVQLLSHISKTLFNDSSSSLTWILTPCWHQWLREDDLAIGSNGISCNSSCSSMSSLTAATTSGSFSSSLFCFTRKSFQLPCCSRRTAISRSGTLRRKNNLQRTRSDNGTNEQKLVSNGESAFASATIFNTTIKRNHGPPTRNGISKLSQLILGSAPVSSGRRQRSLSSLSFSTTTIGAPDSVWTFESRQGSFGKTTPCWRGSTVPNGITGGRSCLIGR